MAASREKLNEFPVNDISNVHEIGLLFKPSPKKTYVRDPENRKFVRRTKTMNTEDFGTLSVCPNGSGKKWVCTKYD